MEGFCSKEDSRKQDHVAYLFEKTILVNNIRQDAKHFSLKKMESQTDKLIFSLDESCDR